MLETIIKKLVESKSPITKREISVEDDECKTELSVKTEDYEIRLVEKRSKWYTPGGDVTDSSEGVDYSYRLRVLNRQKEIYRKNMGERKEVNGEETFRIGDGYNIFKKIFQKYNAQERVRRNQEKLRKNKLLKDLIN